MIKFLEDLLFADFMDLQLSLLIVRTLLFKGGEVNFDYLTHGGAGLLKRGGGWHFSSLNFQGLSFLHLEINLPFANLCYAFHKQLFFSVTIIL